MIPLLVLILFTIIGYIPLIMHTARNRKQQEQEPSPIVPMTDINADIAKTIGRFLLKTLSVCLGLAALLFGFFTVAFVLFFDTFTLFTFFLNFLSVEYCT